MVELGLGTGLRVAEMVALRCGDVLLDGIVSAVRVRRGKGGRSRIVRIGSELVETMREFLMWKAREGQPCGLDAPLLVGRVGPLSKRGIQAVVARAFAAAGIRGHRAHDLRHTYASHLLRASGYNLRLVQKQLGHASIRTTQVYADVLDPDLTVAVEKLYAGMEGVGLR